MTAGRTMALTAGFVGAFALGVAVGPAVWNGIEPNAEPMVTAQPAPPEAPPATATRPAVSAKARSAVLMRERDARARAEESAAASVARAVSEPALHARLKPVLNRGAKMELASDGFRDAEQFAMVAHAARNTEVPFMVLKHRVLNEGQSLAAAIRASKPQLDATAEVSKAREQAHDDLQAITS